MFYYIVHAWNLSIRETNSCSQQLAIIIAEAYAYPNRYIDRTPHQIRSIVSTHRMLGQACVTYDCIDFLNSCTANRRAIYHRNRHTSSVTLSSPIKTLRINHSTIVLLCQFLLNHLAFL
jgi:hypothetical protein